MSVGARMSNDVWPQKIKMSGLPVMLRGWNHEFYKTHEVSDGCPVYQLDYYTHWVGWIIPISIIGGQIKRTNGKWEFLRDGVDRQGIHMFGETPQGSPFGHWSKNGYVAPVE
jgi:hypothetical protein